MKQLEKILKALANRRRLAILTYIKRVKEAPVTDVAREIRLSVKATSKHLAVLLAADIVDRDQRSLQVFYRLGSAIPPAARHIISIL